MLKPLSLVGDYSMLGEQAIAPEWFDESFVVDPVTGRRATAIAYLPDPNHRSIGGLYIADENGRIYEEDEALAFAGDAVIATHAVMPTGPGGGPSEGNKIVRMWSYLVSEFTSWALRVWAGDEMIYPTAVDPDSGDTNVAIAGFTETVAASEQVTTEDYKTFGSCEVTRQAKSVHLHKPEQQGTIAGRCFVFEYRFINPLRALWLGMGAVFEPGKASRPANRVYET